jgi:copper chaperone CopZ
MTKKIYKIEGMHCTSCALMIESDLEDSGVKARCHYAREILEVEYDESKIDEEKIKNVVASSGYKVVS